VEFLRLFSNHCMFLLDFGVAVRSRGYFKFGNVFKIKGFVEKMK